MNASGTVGWILLAIAWLVALGWLWRAIAAYRGLSSIPDLLRTKPVPQGLESEDGPVFSVIVPARNEEKAIEATLRSLLAVEGVAIEIVAVDDRSTDATGSIMDRVAAEVSSGAVFTRNTLQVHHVRQLPSGWLGKTHAMATAARMTTAPWLLFTDADVIFRADSLVRAWNFAERQLADHLVVFPTLIFRSRGERMMLGFLQTFAALSSRPWRVADRQSRRDFIGIGAFNMIRRSVYESIGGFDSLRMEVLEDLRLGYEVKHQGFAQRVAFGHNLLRIHWAAGVFGIMDNMTKNAFAIFRFRLWLLLAACSGVALTCVFPFLGLLLSRWAGAGIQLAGLLVGAILLALYRYYQRYTGTSYFYAVTFPVAACLLLYAILRSMVLTLFRGGVVWRGTHYPLQELRKQCGPLW